MTHEPTAVLLTLPDFDRFARVSGDVNPLHTDEEYARRTVYGQRVAHGVLGLMHALSAPPSWRGELSEVSAAFMTPLLSGVPHLAEVDRDALHELRVRLRDGRRLAVKLSAKLRERALAQPAAAAHVSVGSAPRERDPEDLCEGSVVRGVYGVGDANLDALLRATGLETRGLPRWQIATLLACSYVVGIEVPGRQALFTALQVTFEPGVLDDVPGFDYEARVVSYDERFDRVVVGARFSRAGRPLAEATMKAFVRPRIPSVVLPVKVAGASHSPRNPLDVRKVALITGASRGLGASLASELVTEGWSVIGTYGASTAEAEALREWSTSTRGRFVPLKGDAGDGAFWRDAVPAMLAEHSRLDLLVCNAFPPLQPLWTEPAALNRIVDYIVRGVTMTLTPMAHLLETLASHGGTLLLISSVAVEGAPAEWPHYVAAKAAVEGLAHVAASEYPTLRVIIARPPRLGTEFTNTPMAREAAMAPSRVARLLVDIIGTVQEHPAGVQIVESFEDETRGAVS